MAEPDNANGPPPPPPEDVQQLTKQLDTTKLSVDTATPRPRTPKMFPSSNRFKRYETLPAPPKMRTPKIAVHTDDLGVSYEVYSPEKKADDEDDANPQLQFVSSPLNLEPEAELAKRVVLQGEAEDDEDGTMAALQLADITDHDREQLGGTDPELVDLLRKNREWIKKNTTVDPQFFKRMALGQSPKYFYIGCCDSRVDPNAMMGLPPGSMFVHRNIGNLVCSADMNCHAAIEYAVDVLKVQHIIVCGHYDCGAVKASMRAGLTLPPLVEYWVRNIRDVQREHQEELSETDDFEKMHRRLVELNVIEQCLNIFKVGMVQKKRRECVDKGDRFLLPRIHGLAFDPADGKVIKLNLQWSQQSHALRKIYELHSHRAENSKIWFGDQKRAGARHFTVQPPPEPSP